MIILGSTIKFAPRWNEMKVFLKFAVLNGIFGYYIMLNGSRQSTLIPKPHHRQCLFTAVEVLCKNSMDQLDQRLEHTENNRGMGRHLNDRRQCRREDTIFFIVDDIRDMMHIVVVVSFPGISDS